MDCDCKAHGTESGNTVQIRWLGVTTLLFDDGTDQLMVDAMITRPSLFRVMCRPLEPNRPLAERLVRDCGMDRLRAIFITHSHYDHVMDAPNFAALTGATIYGSASTLNVGRGQGTPEAQLREFRIGDEFSVGAFRVRIYPSVHSLPKVINDDLGKQITQPIPPHPRRAHYAEGGSFDIAVTHHGKTCLIKASCNFIPGALDGVHADLFFLSTGQLGSFKPEKREEFYRETVSKLQPEAVVPIHWENFFLPFDRGSIPQVPLFDQYKQNFAFMSDHLRKDGIRFEIMQMLDTIRF